VVIDLESSFRRIDDKGEEGDGIQSEWLKVVD
jgi:hypothetical protein